MDKYNELCTYWCVPKSGCGLGSNRATKADPCTCVELHWLQGSAGMQLAGSRPMDIVILKDK